jgi:ubiquinone/menaquinone biosynthesis C-methylase UbiE
MRVLDYYDDHPISEEWVMRAVRERRHGLDAPLTADDLFEFDQDHYGGLAAIDTLASRAGIAAGSLVLDVCAGLGGPARFLATRRRCRVVALELHPGRAAGAGRLTRRVGLRRDVMVVRADAQTLPFAAERFDACISQEALLHIDDKPAVLAGCRRVLRAGGRLAFTDWIAHPRLGDLERRRLGDWMAATTLQSLDGYRAMLARVGFTDIAAEDVSPEWRGILGTRLERYRALRRDFVRRFGEDRYARYAELYAFFVGLVEGGKLGGGRFTATRR